MPEFRDPDNVPYRVRRAWWPLLGPLDMASSGSGPLSVVMFVVALPVLLAWPVWFVLKLCGVPWKVVTERDGAEVAVEKVRGWRASGRRIDEIVAELRDVPEGDSVELRETSGTEYRENH